MEIELKQIHAKEEILFILLFNCLFGNHGFFSKAGFQPERGHTPVNIQR